jgi:hypothetical protein
VAAQQRYLSNRLGELGQMISDIQTVTPDAPTSSGGGEYDISQASTLPYYGTSTEPSGQTSGQQFGYEDPGHLLLSQQTKARYISPAHFSMISEQVRTL